MWLRHDAFVSLQRQQTLQPRFASRVDQAERVGRIQENVFEIVEEKGTTDEWQILESGIKMNEPGSKLTVGTWNLDNRIPTEDHRRILLDHKCDVWLLTELHPRWLSNEGNLVGWNLHASTNLMGRGQYWAAIMSQSSIMPFEDPHPATASAEVNGVTFWSTILPWRGVEAGSAPWAGSNHAAMTGAAVDALLQKVPTGDLVWGGDWNHSLMGKEHAGSMQGRKHILAAIDKLGLKVPTSTLSHRGDYCTAIDHVGVPMTWVVDGAYRIHTNKLSDHDAYVVSVSRRADETLQN